MNELPLEIINKIMLYNSTPLADMIKQHWEMMVDRHNIYWDFDLECPHCIDMIPIDYPRFFFPEEYSSIAYYDCILDFINNSDLVIDIAGNEIVIGNIPVNI